MMKFGLCLILLIALVPAFTSGVAAQDESGDVQAPQDVHAQLLEVQAKEAELQARARQLDEDLKPENIERSLAGVGSTRPEELRELRRRQLTIERDSVLAQLRILSASRERLEAGVRTLETRAYQESAKGATPYSQVLMGYATGIPNWLVVVFSGLIAVGGIVFVMALIRRSSV